MANIVTIDTVRQGTTEAFEGALKKLGVDVRAILEIHSKRGLSNKDYQALVKLQDECIRVFDLAGTLGMLLLIRDYDGNS